MRPSRLVVVRDIRLFLAPSAARERSAYPVGTPRVLELLTVVHDEGLNVGAMEVVAFTQTLQRENVGEDNELVEPSGRFRNGLGRAERPDRPYVQAAGENAAEKACKLFRQTCDHLAILFARLTGQCAWLSAVWLIGVCRQPPGMLAAYWAKWMEDWSLGNATDSARKSVSRIARTTTSRRRLDDLLVFTGSEKWPAHQDQPVEQTRQA